MNPNVCKQNAKYFELTKERNLQQESMSIYKIYFIFDFA